MWNNINQDADTSQELYHLGVVVENNDPKQMQRIKVSIPNKMEAPIEELDWVGPISRSAFGVGDLFGTMNVPALGSIVLVYFQGGDIKYGLYEGSAISVNFRPHPQLLINYPRRYGFCDPAGNYMYIDYTPNQVSMHLYHKSGTNFDIDNAGNVVGHIVENWRMKIDGNTYIETDGNTDIFTHGNTYVETDGNTDVITHGNTHVETDGNTSIVTHTDTRIETDGNTDVITHGSTVIETDNDTSIISHSNLSLSVGGSTDITSSGPINMTSSSDVTIQGANVYLNP